MIARRNLAHSWLHSLHNSVEKTFITWRGSNSTCVITIHRNCASFFSSSIPIRSGNRLLCRQLNIMESIGGLAADYNNLLVKLRASNHRVVVVEQKLSAACGTINDLQIRLDKLENANISSDFIVQKLPWDIDLDTTVRKVFDKVGCCYIKPIKSFSIKGGKNNNNGKNKSTPVIVKLSSTDDRIKVLKSLAVFRKQFKKHFTFDDVDQL